MKLQLKNRRGFFLPALAVLTFGLTRLLARYPGIVEKVYSSLLYPVFAQLLSFISRVFLFSLDDVFYVGLLFSLLVLIVFLLAKRISLKRTIFTILNVLSAVYISFYLLWGFNYFRKDLNSRLQLTEHTASKEMLLEELSSLINETNSLFCSFEKSDKMLMDKQIEASYQKLSAVFGIKYPSGSRKAKKITFSRFFAQAGISGYYGPFFSEVHVNAKILPIEFPFVLAHEKAHQFGITSEAEANFYAWMVCTKSNSKQIKYSANLQILRFFLFQTYQLKGYKTIISGLDEGVKNDLVRIREHWQKLSNEKVDEVATKVNDTYLKTNKVEKGIEDYHGVVKYIMDFRADTTFQNTHELR